jgi:hypothetical protein
MTKVSKSPQRHTFQADAYVKRCEEEGKEVSEDYLNIYKSARQQDEENMLDPNWQKDNMEYDLRSTDWILEKVRNSESYAQNMYAAICNNDFVKAEMWPLLRMDPDKDLWSASWRHAGGIVADMRQEGDYIDWYCSGSGGLNQEYEGTETHDEWQKRTGYVPESVVTEQIEKDLYKLGWVVVKYDDAKDTNI